MRRNLTWLAVLAMGVGSAAWPAPVAGQQSIVLRYRPQPASRVHTLWWTDVTTTIGEVTAPASYDSITIEGMGLQSLTQRVLEQRGDEYVVEVTIDSARARMRPMGGAWRDVSDAEPEAITARLIVDDRLRVSEIHVSGVDSVSTTQVQILRGFAGRLEFAFPEQPVSVGESWASDMVYPLVKSKWLSDETLSPPAASGDTELVVRSTMTLDSLVARGADTLAYLRFQGHVFPMTVAAADESGQGPVNIQGVLAGSMIWSTGWNAYVSGAIRAQVTIQLQSMTELEQSGFTVRLDAQNRFQVRP